MVLNGILFIVINKKEREIMKDTIQISFALDRDQHAKLQEVAESQNRSLANLLKTMIKQEVQAASYRKELQAAKERRLDTF